MARKLSHRKIALETCRGLWYTGLRNKFTARGNVKNMGLLPKDADILPASDDRIFKTLMISPEAKPFLMKLIAGIIGRKITDVTVHSNELPISDRGKGRAV